MHGTEKNNNTTALNIINTTGRLFVVHSISLFTSHDISEHLPDFVYISGEINKLIL